MNRPGTFEPARTVAYSKLSVKAVDPVDDNGKRRLIGTATTPTPDRMEDIVDPHGASYSLPLPLLAQHSSREPIGSVMVTQVTDAGIRIEAEIPSRNEVKAAGGALDYIERSWHQMKLKLVNGLSIGFRPLEWEPIKGTFGVVFKKWEWLELSAVTIAAQPEATIEQIKAAYRSVTPAASGTPGVPLRLAHSSAASGAAPQGNVIKGQFKMNVQERIQAKEADIVRGQDAVTELMAGADGRDMNDEEMVSLTALNESLSGDRRQLDVLRSTESVMIARSLPATQASQQSLGHAQGQGVAGVVLPRGLRRGAKADLIFRAAVVALVSHNSKKSIDEVCRLRYPNDEEVMAVTKAAVNPANTTTTGWAAELVGSQVAELVDVLAAVSVYGALAARSLRITFDRNGIIKVPARNKVPNLAGVFVGEGQPIPVKRGSLASVSMLPHKAAVISTFTRELAQLSNPSIETVIREGIIEDTGVQIDANLLDAVAADPIRPAGLLNGVTPIASAGNTAENIAADLRGLMSAIINAGGGRDLVLIINPQRIVGLSTVMNAAGQFVFRDEVNNGRIFSAFIISSTDVPADEVIMVDAADFVTATGDQPEWDVSDVATIHEEDTTPLPIATGTAGAGAITAAPVRSLWQTASIGIRMIWPLTWAMRRTGMVAALSGVAW